MESNRILLIAPIFYNYHIEIKKELEKQGYIVDFYDDRPSKNAISIGLIKLKKNLMKKSIDHYMDKIINDTKNRKYKDVFIINNVAFEKEHIEKLKNNHGEARFILYLWDSIENYKHNKDVLSYFERVFSFDPKDCEKYHVKFLPLFYTDKYRKINEDKEKNIYDLMSICTAHPIRYPLLNDLKKYCQDNKIRLFSYLYLATPLLYIYNKIFVEVFKKAKIREFHFKPLTENEIIRIMSQTKAVFDICNENQNGLTIRTIETIGARKKLITTNKNIVKYDFFDKNNIYVFDLESFEIPSVFLETEYHEINESIYKKYSLSNWINTIFGEIQ
ncbi:hypothetical protein [Eubacterium maltosivorans]|uniref:Capsular biosynthesis protein CpsH n=1 Tax=Eubacterium maltosivorans TaxID=2041044 RepID=A0A4P9C5H3_EUBML|nr:hypothetical protein [Eubacterium maltosivorans]QCT70593.1 hypothetical protein CPZ25_004390 [Eubacterium maltosivorans]